MTKTNSTRVLVMVMAAALAAALLVVVAAADPAEARARFKTVTKNFSNTGQITINNSATPPTAATPYPSGIPVSGLKRGKIRDVNVKLKNFSETIPEDADLLLVGPRGQTAVVMSDVGDSLPANGVTLTLDDQAANSLTTGQLINGTFKPTNLGTGDTFLPPAPTNPSAASALSVFNGTNPNGTWNLYVVDDTNNASVGKFQGGWQLEIRARVKR
jgi:hypothetical protein